MTEQRIRRKPDAIRKAEEAEYGKGRPGPGRPKGSTNLVTREVRLQVLGSLGKLNDVELHPEFGGNYLEWLATESPRDYVKLLVKVIPKEINAQIEGGGRPIVHIVTAVPRPELPADITRQIESEVVSSPQITQIPEEIIEVFVEEYEDDDGDE